jgi:hypothetical protein
MKRLLFLLLASFVSLSCFAASTLNGEINLEFHNKRDISEKAFKKEFGETIKATTEWYVGDFFGKEVVFAGVTVKNTGKVSKAYQYYVAFFNKDKELIGAIGQSSFGDEGLKPGEKTQLASCLITLPKDKYKEIKFYQAIFYESDLPAKK